MLNSIKCKAKFRKLLVYLFILSSILKFNVLLGKNSYLISYVPYELFGREKAYSKTIDEAVDYLNKYDGFVFSGGNARNLWLMECGGSDALDSIKKLAGNLRWGFTGGVWVEPDYGFSGDESVIRQLIYGKKYINKKFETDPQTAMVTGIKGMSPDIPQIFSKSGINYLLVTGKEAVGLNRFFWEAADGSRVLVQRVVPFREYGKTANPEADSRLYGVEFACGVSKYNGSVKKTRALLEKASSGIKFIMAEDFFKGIDFNDKSIPVIKTDWVEKRQVPAEAVLMDAEKFHVFCRLYRWAEFPVEVFRGLWDRVVVKNQRAYVEKNAMDLLHRAIGILSAHIDTTGSWKSAIVFNTHSREMDGQVEICLEMIGNPPVVCITDTSGEIIESKVVVVKGKRKLIFEAVKVPPVGYRRYGILPVPGKGDKEGEVNTAGSQAEGPFYVRLEDEHKGELGGMHFFVKVEPESVELTTVKFCDCGPGSIILRLRENSGNTAQARMIFPDVHHFIGSWESDLTERRLRGIGLQENEEFSNPLPTKEFERAALDIQVKPYEIKTIKLLFYSLHKPLIR